MPEPKKRSNATASTPHAWDLEVEQLSHARAPHREPSQTRLTTHKQVHSILRPIQQSFGDTSTGRPLEFDERAEFIGTVTADSEAA